MTTTITIPIDTTILSSLNLSQEEFKRQMLFTNALALYRQQKLSLGKAAELAGYSRMGFIEELQRRSEPIFDFGSEEIPGILAEAEAIQNLLTQHQQ